MMHALSKTIYYVKYIGDIEPRKYHIVQIASLAQNIYACLHLAPIFYIYM